ncbi:MAG: 50S ribosomal protein L32 [Bacilli bacterium]|jgi:large subunit ribosomal protein L32
MAVPFRRTSKTSKRMRRTHYKLNVTGVTTCPNCGAMIKSHTICPQCGYYDGKQVLKGKSSKKTK